MDFERGEVEKREGEVFTVWGRSGWWMIEEREGGGVKEDSFYCGPTGWRWASPVRPVTVTSQTGDSRWSSQRGLIYFFRPTLGRTEDPDKFQQRVLIGRTDTPSVVPTLFLLFEILLLETSPNML
jgi:hypothetical protein